MNFINTQKKKALLNPGAHFSRACFWWCCCRYPGLAAQRKPTSASSPRCKYQGLLQNWAVLSTSNSRNSYPAECFCTGMEIASHTEPIQDPFPKGTVGGKLPETPKGHSGPLKFLSSPGLDTGLRQSLEPLDLWKATSTHPCSCLVEAPCPKKPLRWNIAETSKHKALFTWHWGKKQEWGEMQWKGVFTMPKHNGLFANKGEGLGLPSLSSLRLWWIRPTGSFFFRWVSS